MELYFNFGKNAKLNFNVEKNSDKQENQVYAVTKWGTKWKLISLEERHLN